MRTYLLAALAMLLLTSTQSAIACSRIGPAPTDEELFANATAVFVGHVRRVEEAGVVSLSELLAFPPWSKTEWQPSKAELESLPPFPAVEATFRVVEVFKGKPPVSGKIKLPPPDSCNSPLVLVALDHVFFLTDDNFIRSRDEAMFVYDPPHDDIVGKRKRLLDKLRSLGAKLPK